MMPGWIGLTARSSRMDEVGFQPSRALGPSSKVSRKRIGGPACAAAAGGATGGTLAQAVSSSGNKESNNRQRRQYACGKAGREELNMWAGKMQDGQKNSQSDRIRLWCGERVLYALPSSPVACRLGC
ncbi:hypothetical protein ACFS07_00540 [Undibacterium arcticum]